jgi:tripartite-type tricarboxylate transporter receptor subunit TctC
VPTAAESLPGFDVDSWQGLFAPAGTPAAIVERLNTDVLRISGTPEMIQRLGELGFTAAAGSPSDFAQLVRNESARWSKLVREIGLKPE